MILFRYVFKGLLLRLLLSLLALALLYLLFDLGDQGRRLAAVLGWSNVIAAAGLHLPLVAVQLLPVALLLSAVLFCATLRNDGELEAMRVAGLSKRWMAAPLLLVGIGGAACAYLLDGLVVPHCERKADRLYQNRRVSPLTGAREGTAWIRHGAWFLRRGNKRALAYRVDGDFSVRRRIAGAIAGRDQLSTATDYRILSRGFRRSERRRITVAALGASEAIASSRRLEAQNVRDLESTIARRDAAGTPIILATLMLHSKLAYPLVNVLVAAFALIFFFDRQPRSALRDLGWAMAALLSLWLLIAGGWLCARSGVFAAAWGAWGPIALGLLIVATLHRRKRPSIA